MPSRRRVLAAAFVAASAAGCAEFDPSDGRDGPSGTDESEATDDSRAPDTTGTDGADGTPTGTAADDQPAAQEPDPDLPIHVENRHDEARSLSLTVARDSGQVVHESAHDLEPGNGYEAYNLQEARPDGVERFDVDVEAGGNRKEISVRTNACYGEARVGFDSSGELFATYSIC